VSSRMRTISTVVNPGYTKLLSRRQNLPMARVSPVSVASTVVSRLDTKNERGANKSLLWKESVDGSIFDGMVLFWIWYSGGIIPDVCRSMPYTPSMPRRKLRGTKTKVLLVDEGTLGGNKSASWFKGRYVNLLHKLTSGSGSFSQ